MFPNYLRRGRRREYFIAFTCIISFLIGLSMVTRVISVSFHSSNHLINRKKLKTNLTNHHRPGRNVRISNLGLLWREWWSSSLDVFLWIHCDRLLLRIRTFPGKHPRDDRHSTRFLVRLVLALHHSDCDLHHLHIQHVCIHPFEIQRRVRVSRLGHRFRLVFGLGLNGPDTPLHVVSSFHQYSSQRKGSFIERTLSVFHQTFTLGPSRLKISHNVEYLHFYMKLFLILDFRIVRFS